MSDEGGAVLDRVTAKIYAEWFRTLADPTRVQILDLLAETGRPMAVGEIVVQVSVGQSTVSAHLKALADTGYVLVERRGTLGSTGSAKSASPASRVPRTS